MSANKYAGLPDIDTAPDVYETEDVFPSHDMKAESSDEETGAPARSLARGKNDTHARPEELDTSRLMNPDEVTRAFRRAEKRHHRPRIQYTYPPSPTSSSGPPSPTFAVTPAVPLSRRLRHLQAELAALEVELADPSNPLLQKEEVAPGELIRGIVDVKERLDKINVLKEGRARLVNVVLADEASRLKASKKEESDSKQEDEPLNETQKVRDVADMDRRLGELEKVIGSSSTALDETSPLPPPLLPLLTRLNTQLTLLAQPRHIDNISRRLKLLLSDLERVSNANSQHGASNQRRSGHSLSTSAQASSPAVTQAPSTLQEQLAPILTRLAPLLPHIPHILTRLRTLSALHTSASAFQSTLEGLEEEQKRVRAALGELERAVKGVESSLKSNEDVVKNNVKDLEDRVEEVTKRVDELRGAEVEE